MFCGIFIGPKDTYTSIRHMKELNIIAWAWSNMSNVWEEEIRLKCSSWFYAIAFKQCYQSIVLNIQMNSFVMLWSASTWTLNHTEINWTLLIFIRLLWKKFDVWLWQSDARNNWFWPTKSIIFNDRKKQALYLGNQSINRLLNVWVFKPKQKFYMGVTIKLLDKR